MGLSGMIVANSAGAAWLATLIWFMGGGLFLLARNGGALRGTGWLALACGIFGGIQSVEAMDLVSTGGEYLIALVGMSWAAGSAAFCYGLWRWALQGKDAEWHGP